MGSNDDEKTGRPYQEEDGAPVSLAKEGVLAQRELPGVTARDVSLRQDAPDEERNEPADQDDKRSKGEDVYSEKTTTELDKDLERGIESHDQADTESETSTEGTPNHSSTTARPPQATLRQTLSRTSSTFSRTATVVPRNQRRGLLGRFALIPELERPYDYKNKTKWIITAIVGFAAIAAPLGSAILYPALDQISADLGSTPTVTNLSIAFYMLSMSIFPLWWSSFSETLGRRTVYVVSFSMFVIFSVLSAVSTSIGMFVSHSECRPLMRSFYKISVLTSRLDCDENFRRRRVSVCSSRRRWNSCGHMGAQGKRQSHGGTRSRCSVSILFLTRSRPGSFSISGRFLVRLAHQSLAGYLHRDGVGEVQVCGSQPLFCALQRVNGRALNGLTNASAVWFLVIVGSVILPMIIVLLPETLARQGPLAATTRTSIRPIDTLSRKSTRQSVQEHTKRAGMLTKRLLVDPLQALLYLRFPPVAITVYLAAITFGSLFVMNISIQSSFSSPPYQFSELIVGE
jgi:hypothetical protein